MKCHNIIELGFIWFFMSSSGLWNWVCKHSVCKYVQVFIPLDGSFPLSIWGDLIYLFYFLAVLWFELWICVCKADTLPMELCLKPHFILKSALSDMSVVSFFHLVSDSIFLENLFCFCQWSVFPVGNKRLSLVFFSLTSHSLSFN
jgi:hypothetical protein